MELEDRGIIFDATKKPAQEKVNAFTSLARLSSGTVIAGFQSGPMKHAPTSTVRLCRSRDSGKTWEELPSKFQTTLDGVPGSISSGDILEVDGKLLLFTTWFDRSDPARPLFDPVTEGVLHCKQLWTVSTDEGVTWGKWNVIPTPGLKGTAATGPGLQWSDGTIAHTFESFKEFDDPKPGHHAAWMVLSRDRGKSFTELVPVAKHPENKIYYWDQRLCEGKNPGDYIALFWTHDLTRKQDLTVHFRQANIKDKDPCKPPVTDTKIPGQIASPLLLEDGRILAFVVDRGKPGTMKLWQSRDGGKTWPEKDALTVHTHDERAMLSQGAQNIDFAQYWEDMGKWTFGHPAMRSLGDGRVLLAYYAGAPGCLSVHWARVRV